MVCQRCGRTVAGSESFCGRCGARLGVVGVLTPPPNDAPTGVDSAVVPEESLTVLADGDQTRLLPTGQADLPAAQDSDATRLAPPGTARPAPGATHSDTADHGPLAVGETFGTRYHIIRLLGIGGMGAVYQAWDAELAVTVALKVIRPEVMADPKTAAEIERRFKRELLLARQVTHRNVVRIHDLGDIGGIKYITMPYIDGADLATVLKQEGHAVACACPAHRAFGRVRAGRGAQGGRRPSRSQAGQHHDRRRGPGVDHGLRHRAVDRTADGQPCAGQYNDREQPSAGG